jgi:hypothetical protein
MIVVGTPHGEWPKRARELMPSLAEAPPLPSGTEQLASLQAWGVDAPARCLLRSDAVKNASLDLLAKALPQSHFLVFVDRAPLALARQLSSAEGGLELSAWLAEWQESTQALLRHVQRHRERCLCIDAAELIDAPTHFEELLGQRLGIGAEEFSRAGFTLLQPADSLTTALAAALLMQHRSALSAGVELLACCQPLDVQSNAQHDLALIPLNSSEAVSQLLTLKASQHELDHARALDNELGEEMAKDLQQKLKDRTSESELLLLQLHQVQEELEHYYLRCRELQTESRAVTALASGETGLRVASISVLSTRDEVPYRELTVLLLGAQFGSRQQPSVRLRLVEHHGHPGLVIFANGLETPMLSTWQESGQEDGQPYMLIVPDDHKSQLALQSMPTSDWDLVNASVAALRHWLQRQSVDGRWIGLARRLEMLLREQPRRLRYDGLTVEVDEDRPAAFDISFSNAVYGDRRWDRLHLRWQPDADKPLVVRGPLEPADLPVLKRWPLDEAGHSAANWTVPIYKGQSLDERMELWQQLDPKDAELLLAVLDALPAAATALLSKNLIDENKHAPLVEAARQLLRDAMERPQPSRWRRLAAAMRRRFA